MDSTTKNNGIEREQTFMPTPERVSEYLDRNKDEVLAELSSVEGREKIYSALAERSDELQKIDPAFNPDKLKEQLDLVGSTLEQKKRFLKGVESPEQKGAMRRGWEKVKGFAKKHPVVTTLLVGAAVAGTVAGGYYLAANAETLLAKVGLEHLYGAAGAAEAADPLGSVLGGEIPYPSDYTGPTLPDQI